MAHGDRHARGQAIVEFALVLPVALVLMVGIVDLARVYTTMISIESAAREAADYGAFGSWQWRTPDAIADTVAEMQRRACVAARNLPDYAGPDTACTNPARAVAITKPDGTRITLNIDGSWSEDPAPVCNVGVGNPPCRIEVTLQYAFRPLVPLQFELLGTGYGVPEVIRIERTSIFAISDLGS